MMILLFSVLIAIGLGWTLLRFLRAEDPPAVFPSASVDAHPQFIADAVFSVRDWSFIRREGSPELDSLFTHERRALAIYWLRDCLARIRAVRANHLRKSRHSEDLDAPAEIKLLLFSFYLAALCRGLLIAVHFVHPATPRSFVLYLQNSSARILPSTPPLVFSRVPVQEVSRQRL